MAFFLARRASAKLPPRLGVGVLLRLSDPLGVLRLMPESRCWSSAGLRPAAGRLAGGAGGVGLERGGAGGARGAGGACSSTYAAGTQACCAVWGFLANHHPIETRQLSYTIWTVMDCTYHCSPSAQSRLSHPRRLRVHSLVGQQSRIEPWPSP